MQLRYVATEFGTGLKRNVSMTIAVILTIWISLSLVGIGLMMQSQVGMFQRYLGDQLEVKIVFCAKNSLTPTCVQGQATRGQEKAVEATLAGSKYVSDYRYETRDQAFQGYQARTVDSQGPSIAGILKLKPADMSTSYWATLAHPDDNTALVSLVSNLPGVEQVVDLRERLAPVYEVLNLLKWLALGGAALLVMAAVLQVSNTIRLAAMARRREIGIMRLVGASSVYIQLPFLLEILFAAIVGAALACGGLVVAMRTVVPWLHRHTGSWPWVGWPEARPVLFAICAVAFLLAVVPTLFMTRKYLKV
ncbi:MAG: FtsX-like permease family protein [Propionibacteriales bacterium]|nr:FtsX-like permease family protein [Propionibacteriales bacterium]